MRSGSCLSNEDVQEPQGKAFKVVVLEELIQVDAKQLKHQAEVLSPEETISHADYVVFIINVHPLVQKLQHTNFYTSLHCKSMPPLVVRDASAARQLTKLVQPCGMKQNESKEGCITGLFCSNEQHCYGSLPTKVNPARLSNLLKEGILVFDDFDSDMLSCLLTVALDHLPKGALPQHLFDQIPVA